MGGSSPRPWVRARAGVARPKVRCLTSGHRRRTGRRFAAAADQPDSRASHAGTAPSTPAVRRNHRPAGCRRQLRTIELKPRFCRGAHMQLEWLNYHHLLYFWVVAREGGIARASRQLLVAEPTISGQVKALEAFLGERLFVRSGRTLALTETGR